MKALPAGVRRQLRDRHGVISRGAALAGGMTDQDLRRLVANGEWHRLHPSVYRPATVAPTVENNICAAVLAGGVGAVASHQSAAWLWGMLRRPPRRQAITVDRASNPRLGPGVALHRSGDLDPGRSVLRSAIPCTDPARTLIDLAGVASRPVTDDAVDRALMSHVVDLDRLTAELGRLAKPGRVGVGALRASLRARGHLGAPQPSVLESRILRLFARHGIRPVATEVVVDQGRYRIDVMLSPTLGVEVDGYVYHASAPRMRADLRRRNDLARRGLVILTYTWADVVDDGDRVCREVVGTLRDLSSRAGPGHVSP